MLPIRNLHKSYWIGKRVIPSMEKVIRERFDGKYPARKSIQTEFAHKGGPEGLRFQLNAIAYNG